MTKSVAKLYYEALEQSQNCKPHSQRKTILTKRVSDLLLRQMKIELKSPKPRKECRS